MATELRISTRTLYTRIGNRDSLIRQVVQLHFAKLSGGFDEVDSWELTAWNWCNALHIALCSHPHLTYLMTDSDELALVDYVDALVKVAIREGIPPDTAVECCRSLVEVTMNDAIRKSRSTGYPGGSPVLVAEIALAPGFRKTVDWIVAGVRAELWDARESGYASGR